MSARCLLISKNCCDCWCERHGMPHHGTDANTPGSLSQGDDEKSINWRLAMDKAVSSGAVLPVNNDPERTFPEAKECIHFGKLLDKTTCGAEVNKCSKHQLCSWQELTCVGTSIRYCGGCSDYKKKDNSNEDDLRNLS